MKFPQRSLAVVVTMLANALVVAGGLPAAEWSIPVAGNAFRTAPGPGGNGFQRDGTIAWSDPAAVFSMYFHVDRPAKLTLAIKAGSKSGRSTLATRVGEKKFSTVIDGIELADRKLGRVSVEKAGYVRVDFRGSKRTGDLYAAIGSLGVSSETAGLVVDYVRTNKGNMFYWGRRGPSVHL
ncbi:MAG TPA: hypothetical protein DCE43_14210, partial [Planctomycetaceae bacterium]|nr:hypothetical protein [Planctomycetaceae bacterium]